MFKIFTQHLQHKTFNEKQNFHHVKNDVQKTAIYFHCVFSVFFFNFHHHQQMFLMEKIRECV